MKYNNRLTNDLQNSKYLRKHITLVFCSLIFCHKLLAEITTHLVVEQRTLGEKYVAVPSIKIQTEVVRLILFHKNKYHKAKNLKTPHKNYHS